MALAVLQTQNDLQDEINLLPTQFFTDSEDVLAWINNKIDSFILYVTTRRGKICQVADPSQWHWIPGPMNPVDIGTRGISVEKLLDSEWITGPTFHLDKDWILPGEKEKSDLQTSSIYKQEMKKSKCLTTRNVLSLDNELMDGSAWSKLLYDSTSPDPVKSLVRSMQEQAFPEGLGFLYKKNIRSLSHPYQKLAAMSPFTDKEGLIRCGGRLHTSYLAFGRKHPILVPERYEGDALLEHIHANKAAHQGRIVSSD